MKEAARSGRSVFKSVGNKDRAVPPDIALTYLNREYYQYSDEAFNLSFIA